MGMTIAASLLVAVYVCLGLGQIGFGFLVAIAGIGGAVAIYNNLMANAKAMCSTNCAAIKSSVGYYGWQGTCHMFEVTSSSYALAFMLANQNKLVNVRPEIWQWLQSNGYRPLQGNQAQAARRHMT
jgi:hypothetical protein